MILKPFAKDTHRDSFLGKPKRERQLLAFLFPAFEKNQNYEGGEEKEDEATTNIKGLFSLFCKLWQFLGTLYYINMGLSIRGFTPFTAQILSSIVSFLADEVTELATPSKKDGNGKSGKLVIIAVVNLVSAQLSLSLGFYSFGWC